MMQATLAGKDIKFVIDTGSSLAVVDMNYNSSSTNTYVNYTQSYNRGQCDGVFGTDKLIVESLNVNSFTMLYSRCVNLPFFSTSVGMMGLSNYDVYTNIFEHIGLSNSFALELHSVNQSKLHYNISSSIVNTIWFPTTRTYKWIISHIGIYLNDVDITEHYNNEAFFDSGYSCLVLSNGQFNMMWDIYLSSVCTKNNNRIYCQCNAKLPDIIVYFRGNKLTIYPHQYLLFYQNSNKCRLCIQYMNIDYIILGIPAFFSNTIVFDKSNQQIGISEYQAIQQLPMILPIIILSLNSILIVISIIVLIDIRQLQLVQVSENELQLLS